MKESVCVCMCLWSYLLKRKTKAKKREGWEKISRVSEGWQGKKKISNNKKSKKKKNIKNKSRKKKSEKEIVKIIVMVEDCVAKKSVVVEFSCAIQHTNATAHHTTAINSILN